MNVHDITFSATRGNRGGRAAVSIGAFKEREGGHFPIKIPLGQSRSRRKPSDLPLPFPPSLCGIHRRATSHHTHTQPGKREGTITQIRVARSAYLDTSAAIFFVRTMAIAVE